MKKDRWKSERRHCSSDGLCLIMLNVTLVHNKWIGFQLLPSKSFLVKQKCKNNAPFSEGHVWVHGFTAVELGGRNMLMFMTYVTTKSMLVSVGHVAARGHVHVNGLCRLLRPCHVLGNNYHQRPCRCHVPLLKSMLMSMGQAAVWDLIGVYSPCYPRGHIDVFGLCYHWRLWWYSWPML